MLGRASTWSLLRWGVVAGPFYLTGDVVEHADYPQWGRGYVIRVRKTSLDLVLESPRLSPHPRGEYGG